MPRRRPLIVANWKMHLGRVDEARTYVRRVRPALTRVRSIDVALCPPFTVLADLARVLEHSPIDLGAQDAHWEGSGAHTGHIAPVMLAGLCRYVIVGHSERRASSSIAESDEAVNRKVHAVLAADLTPIICVGEDLDQKESGDTERVISEQIATAFGGLEPSSAAQCAVAYEPVWAIGSGRAATPAAANTVMGLTIRGRLADLFGENVADEVRLLYGGSVTAANIGDFMAMPDIDGALVGGASLDANGFVELVRNAAVRVESPTSKV